MPEILEKILSIYGTQRWTLVDLPAICASGLNDVDSGKNNELKMEKKDADSGLIAFGSVL